MLGALSQEPSGAVWADGHGVRAWAHRDAAVPGSGDCIRLPGTSRGSQGGPASGHSQPSAWRGGHGLGFVLRQLCSCAAMSLIFFTWKMGVSGGFLLSPALLLRGMG